MSFRERYLEEAIDWERVKDFSKRNAGILAGVGGAGLGAAYNYLTGGADQLQQERAQELAQYINKDSTGDLVNSNALSKDDFTTARDAFIRGAGYDGSSGFGLRILARPMSWLSGQTEDFSLKNAEDSTKELLQFQKEHPEARIQISSNGITRPDMKIDNYEINPYKRSDVAYEDYLKDQEYKFKTMSPDERLKFIEKNPELSDKLKEMQNAATDKEATKDSYTRAIVGGALLGAGGHAAGKFAKRKLDEKNGRV
jgi:hypothetical protein